KAHKLQLQCCSSCGKFWFPPSRRCAHCLSADLEWRESNGHGRIYSFVVFHRVYHPAFESEVPYAVAIVELDERPRLLANIIPLPSAVARFDIRFLLLLEGLVSQIIPHISTCS